MELSSRSMETSDTTISPVCTTQATTTTESPRGARRAAEQEGRAARHRHDGECEQGGLRDEEGDG